MLEFLSTPQPWQPAQVTGQWQVVRLCLDQAAQEWLNVGVVLHVESEQPHTRLLRNVRGLACLYDEDAADNARFLIEQAAFALEADQPLPAGWNIALGESHFVRGRSATSIVDNLFSRVVPLGRHEADDAQRADREDHLHATKNVRATVRQLISEHLQLARGAAPDFWQRKPTLITRDDQTLSLDVQIASHIDGRAVHGAVASAWYKTAYHRNASLSTAAAATVAACDAFPNSTNLLYLLQPPPSAHGLDAADQQAIAEAVNTCAWLVKQRGGQVRVAHAERGMARDILNDLHLMAAVA